jgi:hypothetical protein
MPNRQKQGNFKTNRNTMTPKEKAEELVDKFFKDERLYWVLSYNQAKQCALIAVDEILKRNEPIQGHFWDYWEEVKQEIEKL